MADILLNKSAVSQSISCVPDARFVFGFSPEDATLSRSGDDFVLTFEDGSTITLAGFYTTYSSEQMPSFSVEGAEISGEDFFTAMNEPDLMPAAGPAQQAADGARYRSWANMDLLDGIDRLGGLDVGWQDPTPDDDDEGGADDINWPVSIVPGTPADTPDVPAYDENGNTVAPGLVVEHLIVHESALKGGNPGEGDESVTDSGSMLISARDGVQSITVNGVTVVSGEALTDTLEIATDEGVLTVTGFTFDAASGNGVLEFKFDLSNNTLEHEGVQGENGIGHVFTVTVTDVNAESASADIFVEVVDDMPEAEGEEGETLHEAVVVAESEKDIDSGVFENSGNVLRNELYGADGKAAEYVTWGDASVSGDAPLASYGSLALAEDGSWKFVLDTDSDVVKKMSDGDSVTVSVPYTVTDADGDIAQATLTFKIEGADNAVSIVPDPDPEQPGDEPTPPVQPGDDPTYPDQPMVDEDPAVHGDELTVYEAGLEDGTAPGQQDVSVSGSMSIYAPDVLASVVVSFGGKEFELFNGQTASFDIGEGDNGAAGVFEASYNANTGKLEYTFTLNDDHQHDAAFDSADWTVGVTVKDSDGSADATSIKLTIVDDKPKAEPDYAGLVKANTSLAANASDVTSREATSLAGSVLTGVATDEGHEAAALKADTLGADGVNGVTWAATATVGKQTVDIVNGKAVTDYGTLTLNADGTYSFTIADSAAVKAMAEGDIVTVSVDYTITDADGDSSEATLTLKVKGSDDGITIAPEYLTVHESALPGGNPAPEKGLVKADGSMEIAAPDGLASIKIGETEVWKNGSLTDTTTVSTDEGVLTVTGYDVAEGELSFSFTLNQATQEHSAQGEDSITHTFDVTVSDKDGDSDSASIVVTIVDDMPVIVAEGTADEATSFDSDGDQQADGMQSLSGKFTVDFGADDMAEAPFALVDGEKTFDFKLKDGKYSVTTPDGGTLTLEAVPGSSSGEYEYAYVPSTKNDSFFGREFTIQMKDKDGDTVTTTVTVERDFTPDLAIGNARIVVDEGSQPEGEHGAAHGQSGIGSFTVDLHGELGSISVGGKSVVVEGQSKVSAEAPAFVIVNGVKISITSAQLSSDGKWEVRYSYELTEAQDHGLDGTAEDTALIGSVDILVTDASHSVDGKITVEVHDDVPTIAASVGATVLTLPDNNSATLDPLFVTTGSVTASAGADGFPDGADHYVMFDGEAMGDSLAVVVNGEAKTASLSISEDGLTLTATVGSSPLFSAVLTEEGGLTVNQYANFTLSVDENGTSAQSNTLQLQFVTRDGDSDHDTATASVDIPLKLGVSVGGNKDNDGSNTTDQAAIQLGGDSAGHVAAGDTGGSDVSTTTTAPKNYNVSIILDLSASMNDKYSSSGPSAGNGGSRMEMAVDALTNFISNYLSQHTGIVNLQVVGFGSWGSKGWQYIHEGDKTNNVVQKSWVINNSSSNPNGASVSAQVAAMLEDWEDAVLTSGYRNNMGTNYGEGLNASKVWFNNVKSNGYENIAYFITDGVPTYATGDVQNTDKYGSISVNENGSTTTSYTAVRSLEEAEALKGVDPNLKLNCIAIGTEGTGGSLKAGAVDLLDIMDNTGGNGTIRNGVPVGSNVICGNVQFTVHDALVVNTPDALSAALAGGSSSMNVLLAAAGDDDITSESSSVIYGDMLFADRLLKAMNDAGIENSLVYGDGYKVFQWLENAENASLLAGTVFDGWNASSTADYILANADQMGWETAVRLVTTSSTTNGTTTTTTTPVYYLVDLEGNVWEFDGSGIKQSSVSLSDVTMPTRAGGDDAITGSDISEHIYGQEGNDAIYAGGGDDVIYGGTGHDMIFGGSGNDVVKGGAGDDFIHGGGELEGNIVFPSAEAPDGADQLYGGSGNDIFVYDAQDIFQGGDGIDFLLSTGTENLSSMGEKVNDIEVLIKGNADALKGLTSIGELSQIGITVETKGNQEVLTLDSSKWTGYNGVYANNAGLTIETSLPESGDADFATAAMILQLTATSN